MPNSMTAFSRIDVNSEFGSLIFELKSVNHRFIEINFKIPELFKKLELQMRDLLKEALVRGKVECSIIINENTVLSETKIDQAQLENYLDLMQKVKSKVGEPDKISITDVLNLPGVLNQKPVESSGLEKFCLEGFKETIKKFKEFREIEGKKLKKDITEKIKFIDVHLESLEKELPRLLDLNRKRLEKRISDLAVQIDRDRLDQEMVLLANRSDIDEEIVRLRSHSSEVIRLLDTDNAIGRKLDFLMQEMNREANTIGSKSLSEFTSKVAIELKVLIEQIREQVQNIE
ncbi:MAG: YicC/YloC family endoribonuclease [Pseudomonadota bacterium]|nr:YicC/YloC family endoribonuclease [Pseudomonadota bacterium]